MRCPFFFKIGKGSGSWFRGHMCRSTRALSRGAAPTPVQAGRAKKV